MRFSRHRPVNIGWTKDLSAGTVADRIVCSINFALIAVLQPVGYLPLAGFPNYLRLNLFIYCSRVRIFKLRVLSASQLFVDIAHIYGKIICMLSFSQFTANVHSREAKFAGLCSVELRCGHEDNFFACMLSDMRFSYLSHRINI